MWQGGNAGWAWRSWLCSHPLSFCCAPSHSHISEATSLSSSPPPHPPLSICSALKRRKRKRQCLHCAHLWGRTSCAKALPVIPVPLLMGHKGQAHSGEAETTRRALDSHPDGCCPPLQPAQTLPGAGCAQEPVCVPQLPNATSQLPLLAPGVNFFAVKAADKLRGS